jgi:hypothetical protein
VEEIEEEEAPANRSGIPADAADLPHQQEVN